MGSPFDGDGPDALFQQALARGEFRLQRCRDCGRAIFYPRLLCPHCGSRELDWFTPSGRGTVHSTSTVRVKPGKGESYNISLIEMEEGPRLMSRVVDVAVDDVKIGLRVTAFVGEIDGQAVVLFRREEAEPRP
jgi:uncharacterized OB-fold protein